MVDFAKVNVLMDSGLFPIQGGEPIPWAEAEDIYRDYSYLYGTSQTLRRLGERGGFGIDEIPMIRRDAARRREQVAQTVTSGFFKRSS